MTKSILIVSTNYKGKRAVSVRFPDINAPIHFANAFSHRLCGVHTETDIQDAGKPENHLLYPGRHRDSRVPSPQTPVASNIDQQVSLTFFQVDLA